MNLMKQNQDNMQLELLQMRQFMRKYAPNEAMPPKYQWPLKSPIPIMSMDKYHKQQGYIVLL
ncbi:hypothetical protein H5410_002312 [Solanum commersonii]|uniref:Uncharacterized protein n=1 Tax=Solanum commersonii TaxID=4109 RepID=A0A9J6B1Z6_SOLCO|nr:hypothetical protein H5410_002312 [Solanum commersonii]